MPRCLAFFPLSNHSFEHFTIYTSRDVVFSVVMISLPFCTGKNLHRLVNEKSVTNKLLWLHATVTDDCHIFAFNHNIYAFIAFFHLKCYDVQSRLEVVRSEWSSTIRYVSAEVFTWVMLILNRSHTTPARCIITNISRTWLWKDQSADIAHS